MFSLDLAIGHPYTLYLHSSTINHLLIEGLELGSILGVLGVAQTCQIFGNYSIFKVLGSRVNTIYVAVERSTRDRNRQDRKQYSVQPCNVYYMSGDN